MTRSFAAGTPKRGERLAPALRVDDDPLEATERAPPEAGLAGGPAGQEVVRGQHEWSAMPEEEGVQLGRGEPLHVDDVGRGRRESREAERMLDRLQRQPQAGAREQPRRERVEELPAAVPVRGRRRRRSENAT